MHISEGILSAPVLVTGAVLAAGGVVVGLRRLDVERLPVTAVLTAVFFVASLVHVPVGPANAHLVLNGLLGVLLGWICFPAVLVAALLQAMLFQFGGLTTLGVNTLSMALPPVLCGFAFRGLLGAGGSKRKIAAFCCGGLSVLLSGVLAAVALGLSDEGFLRAAQILAVAHLPVAAVEGIVTVFVVSFLARVRPEMLPEAVKGKKQEVVSP